MSQFFGVLRHEFKMAVKRPGMWVAYGLLYIFYGFTVIRFDSTKSISTYTLPEMWNTAGETMFILNIIMVLLGGILAADRMQRDFRLGMRELQQCAPLRLSTYILAKYFGVLAAVLTPMFVYVLVISLLVVILGGPLVYAGIFLVAFAAMGIPAYAFVVAFSLVCPLVMPVRVYQVLFVGYWFWGNYLNPNAFPTISGTLLVPSGRFVLNGFFGGLSSLLANSIPEAQARLEAVFNLLLLFSMIMLVLVAARFILRRKALRS
jgi:ABC-2 type transport system permease protein